MPTLQGIQDGVAFFACAKDRLVRFQSDFVSTFDFALLMATEVGHIRYPNYPI